MPVTTKQRPKTRRHTTMISSMDDVVEVAAEARLMKSPYRELQQISCESRQGVVTLRGRVSSYYIKQIAQEFVGQLIAVVEVDNRLNVVQQPT
jgi:osmotically-inducible protein OsmY